jgi:hypothetical protein
LVSFKHYKFQVSCPYKEYIRVSQSRLTNSWVQYRVNQLVTKHLSAQGRLDPRGGLHCFWYPNKTWTPSLDAFGTLKLVKNGIELKKLQPLKVQGVKTSKKKKPSNITKAGSQTPKKIPCIFAMLLLEFKNDF